jgi:hypothetical protein
MLNNKNNNMCVYYLQLALRASIILYIFWTKEEQLLLYEVTLWFVFHRDKKYKFSAFRPDSVIVTC